MSAFVPASLPQRNMQRWQPCLQDNAMRFQPNCKTLLYLAVCLYVKNALATSLEVRKLSFHQCFADSLLCMRNVAPSDMGAVSMQFNQLSGGLLNCASASMHLQSLR